MSDTPIQRKPPPKIDRALVAHERRARLIAQLHEQAVATANDLATQRKAITAVTIKDGFRRKAEPCARRQDIGVFKTPITVYWGIE